MNTPACRTSRRVSLTLTILFLSGSFLALWASAFTEGPLAIPDPGTITEKKTVKVTDPGNPNRDFVPAKFTVVTTDPAGIVQVAKPTTNDATFAITPLKSGTTKLTIQYVDGDTTLKGTRDLVVPFKSILVQGVTGDQPMQIVAGTTKQANVSGVDMVSGVGGNLTQAEVTSADQNVVKASFSGQQLKLEPQSVGSTTVTIKSLGVTKEIKVQVTEGVVKIEVNNRGAVGSGDLRIVIPESETRQFKLRIVGSNGTEFKRTDVKLETAVTETDNCGVALQATYDEKDENVLIITTPALIPTPTGACTSAERIVTLTVPAGPMAATAVTTRLILTITQKLGFIKLTASSPVLSQNSKITITAEVFNRANILIALPPNVEFELQNSVKTSIWVALVKEGNKATLVSRNPSQQEIREKNNGELVPRPSEVVVIAKTRLDLNSPEIESSIIITLGEVVGFDMLKVKLNIMDERTAGDLYGRVTSDEYYVLIVRLFNNLEDERTGEFTGNSILAYSSSIEIAVQLEKRFDRDGTDSYFPTIISKSQAQALVNSQPRIAAAEKAQADLNTAIDEQYSTRQDAIKRVNEAMQKRSLAERLTSIARAQVDPDDRRDAFAKANQAINEYNLAWAQAEAALQRAETAEDVVMQHRAQIVRDSLNRSMDTQVLLTDPDTAIDDGKWHPMSPADLIRLGTTPVPSAKLPALERGLLPVLTEADMRARPRRITPSGGSAEAEEKSMRPKTRRVAV